MNDIYKFLLGMYFRMLVVFKRPSLKALLCYQKGRDTKQLQVYTPVYSQSHSAITNMESNKQQRWR